MWSCKYWCGKVNAEGLQRDKKFPPHKAEYGGGEKVDSTLNSLNSGPEICMTLLLPKVFFADTHCFFEGYAYTFCWQVPSVQVSSASPLENIDQIPQMHFKFHPKIVTSYRAFLRQNWSSLSILEIMDRFISSLGVLQIRGYMDPGKIEAPSSLLSEPQCCVDRYPLQPPSNGIACVQVSVQILSISNPCLAGFARIYGVKITFCHQPYCWQ